MLRIESKKINKSRNLIVYCSIGLLAISLFKLINSDSSQIGSVGWWIDLTIVIVFSIFNMLSVQRKLFNRTNQFIEWNNNKIHYKLKDDLTSQTIEESKIENVKIGIDIMEIRLIGGETFKLDITDFEKYEDRIRIKSNLEKYKKNSA